MCLDFGMLQIGMVCDADAIHHPFDEVNEPTAVRLRRNTTVAYAIEAHVNRRHEDGRISRLAVDNREETCYGALSGETGHRIIEYVPEGGEP